MVEKCHGQQTTLNAIVKPVTKKQNDRMDNSLFFLRFVFVLSRRIFPVRGCIRRLGFHHNAAGFQPQCPSLVANNIYGPFEKGRPLSDFFDVIKIVDVLLRNNKRRNVL